MKKEEEGSVSTKPANSMFQMMNHIQSLISMAVENAKQEEKSISHQKSKSIVPFSHQPKHQYRQCILNLIMVELSPSSPRVVLPGLALCDLQYAQLCNCEQINAICNTPAQTVFRPHNCEVAAQL